MDSLPDSLCERMAKVRGRGTRQIQKLDHALERLTDWREHYKAHPWAALLAASIAGYALVPNYRSIPSGSAPSRNESSPVAHSIGAMNSTMSGLAIQLVKSTLTRWVQWELTRRFASHTSEASSNTPVPNHRRF